MSAQKNNTEGGHHHPGFTNTLFGVYWGMAKPPEFEGELYKYAWKRLRDHASSMDTVQDSGCSLYQLSYALDPIPNEHIESRDHARALVWRVHHARVIDKLRDIYRRSEVPLDLPSDDEDHGASAGPPSNDSSPDMVAAVHEFHREHRERIAKIARQVLGDAEYEAFILAYIQGLSHEAAAQLLHIKRAALDQRLSRARRTLRELLGGDFLDFFDP